MKSVTRRVESVSRASRIMSNISLLARDQLATAASLGSGALTTGFGFFSHSADS